MNDLIRRQDAIDAIMKIPDSNWTSRHYANAIKTVKPTQQWIPCSERLPDKYVDEDGILIHYLVCDSDGDIGTGFYEPDSDEHWDVQWPACNDAYFDIRIVAWMPLPEPYKESEEVE